MGTALARIHFVAAFDGRDVEFILGGALHHANVEPAFFVIDFNQMRRVPPGGGDAVVQQLAEAVWTNDPYVPRAESPFWPAFRAGYEAAAADAGALATAQAVLAALAAHWQETVQERSSTDDIPL
jgi:Zinc finger protein